MRIFVLAAAIGTLGVPAAAQAQWGYGYSQPRYSNYNREVRREQRECQRELRRADNRREYRQELRECRRELRQAQRQYRRNYYDDRNYGYYNNDRRRYWDGYQWRYRW